MPSRIIREGILTSERVNKLGPHAELFYRRLMSVVDDYGRFYAHPALLRASCYPLRVDEVRETDISRWLTEVESAGLIALYAVNSKRYLEMIDFRQQVRQSKSKFPGSICLANDNQLQSGCDPPATANAHLGVVEDEDVCEAIASTATQSKPNGSLWGKGAIQFDPHNRQWIGITEKDRAMWSDAYPAVDLDRDLSAMIAWIVANPQKRKSNYVKFITSWLTKTQDRGGSIQSSRVDCVAQPLTSAEIAEMNRLHREGKLENPDDD